MNVEELLELMEETLEAGTAVPFAASKRVVDVDRMRDIIDAGYSGFHMKPGPIPCAPIAI